LSAHPTGTVTFLFTDIEGSTRLAREQAGRWDAFCVAFNKAGDALQASLQAQLGVGLRPRRPQTAGLPHPTLHPTMAHSPPHTVER
jgi:hypothetical protein